MPAPIRTLTHAARSAQASELPSTALQALTVVVERLAAGDPLDASIPAVIRTVESVLPAREVSVWLLTPGGLERTWAVGDKALTSAAVTAAGAPPREDLTVVRLVSGATRLGAIAIAHHAPLSSDDRALVNATAHLLAPQIFHAEQHRQLEVEVAARTRQIDEERRFTERIIDALPVGLYVIDREYRIQAWNRKRETGMQGISRDEAIGRPIFDILHRQPADLLRREFDEVFESGRLQSFQVESLATGELRTYRISKIPMRIGGDEVTHIVTIGEDVTEWKEAEGRFAQAEKLAALGQLAAGAMHEINNPLATIAACAESLGLRLGDLAAAGVDIPSGTTDYVRIIDNEVRRSTQIVDGLLDFARPRKPHKEQVDVNETIRKTLFLLKHHARFKRLTVDTQFDEALPRVGEGSGEQLVQVIMALLLNAMDAVGGQGSIVVRTRTGTTRREEVVAEVVDTGHGIARSEISKIFEPFYTTKEAGRGTGLGLSICYGIVTEHGGRIEVESVLGQGSTFRVLLPASTA